MCACTMYTHNVDTCAQREIKLVRSISDSFLLVMAQLPSGLKLLKNAPAGVSTSAPQGALLTPEELRSAFRRSWNRRGAEDYRIHWCALGETGQSLTAGAPAETAMDELSGPSDSEQRGESSTATGVSAAGVSGQSLTADASAGSESGTRIVPGLRPPGMPEFMPPLQPLGQAMEVS